jgi:hypothetical protein
MPGAMSRNLGRIDGGCLTVSQNDFSTEIFVRVPSGACALIVVPFKVEKLKPYVIIDG